VGAYITRSFEDVQRRGREKRDRASEREKIAKRKSEKRKIILNASHGDKNRHY
jgi:hypothetical protein